MPYGRLLPAINRARETAPAGGLHPGAINGRSPDERLAIRQERSRSLVADLETRLRVDRAKLSPKNDTARAIDYMLKRWPAFARFLGKWEALPEQQCSRAGRPRDRARS